ncbi:hypothetical protein [Microbacterium sp. NPDC077057]|uniref:hypothetical protein n=1 Tax=unclassified Microbacterium TaxID=2609290 RepID=UPI00342D0998
MTLNLDPPTATRTLVALIDAEDPAEALAQATTEFNPVYLLQVLSTAVASLLDAQGITAADDAALVTALVEAENDR